MKKHLGIILPLAGVAALGLGGLAVSAASPPPATTSPGQTFVDKLAGILHLTPTQLQTDIKQARLQAIDQMLADGRITQAQADAMKARVNSGKPGFGAPHPGGPGGPRIDPKVARAARQAGLKATADTLKMTPDALRTALRDGKKLPDLEAAAGVSDATLRAAVQAAVKGVLGAAVKAGTITQAQADMILKGMDRRPSSFAGRHGPGPRTGPGTGPQQAPPTSTQ